MQSPKRTRVSGLPGAMSNARRYSSSAGARCPCACSARACPASALAFWFSPASTSPGTCPLPSARARDPPTTCAIVVASETSSSSSPALPCARGAALVR